MKRRTGSVRLWAAAFWLLVWEGASLALAATTGEHWYGVQALEKGLVDAVETSDELLLGLMESHEVIGVRYQQRKKMLDRFTGSAAESADRLLLRWWQRGQKPLM